MLFIAWVWSASAAADIRIPEVTGFREFATYLRDHGAADSLLYDGEYDGLFGFYLRAGDSHFTDRFVRADRALYSYGPGPTFEWTETSSVKSADDVLTMMRNRLGCRWVAVEVPRPVHVVLGRRLLREALSRPEFEFVKSFAISGAGERRIDLYRFTDAIRRTESVDLIFPTLTNHAFRDVTPLTR